MPRDSIKQRLKILYLYKILFEKTDEEHSITMPQIIEELKKYGISTARKALYSDIEALKEFGVDIVLERRNNIGYRIVNREFEIPELVLLADAVTCSHFFTQKKADALVHKLEQLCSVHEAKKIDSRAFVLNSDMIDNERIYLNVDTIHRAIFEKKQISFKYFDYDLKKRKKYRGDLRVCSPYAFTWNNEKYYLIAYYNKYDGVSHFRVDKMDSVQVLDEPAQTLPEDFSLRGYLRSTFSMFCGTAETVKLRFENSLIGAVIDHFGRKIPISPEDDAHFIVEASVLTEYPGTFFGWIFQFGAAAEILEPLELKNRYISALQTVLNKETHN